jgi:Tfp pilus assembly protein PilF
MSATILPYLLSTDHMYFTRYWYLPAAGASILYATAILAVSAKARSAQPAAVLILLVAIGYFAIGKAHTFEGRYLFHAANYYLAHRSEPEQAEQYYLRVIHGYGYGSGLAYSQLGVSQTRSGLPQEAMTSLKQATTVDPNHAVSHRNLGTLQWKAGISEGSVESFEKAIALDQDHTSLLPELGSELIRLEKWELAIRVWEAAVQYWPEQSETQAYLGVSSYNAGRQSEARDKLDAALRLDSENTVALLGLGIISELEGNSVEALRLYEKGFAVEPDNPEFKTRLSNLTKNTR